jgi:hypothetical protein
MEISNLLSNNELRKAALLITEASRLGMDLSGYCQVDVNMANGNVYLWLEDYPFSLFIDLGGDKVQACWTEYESGGEEFMDVNGQSVYDLEQWCAANERKHEELELEAV